MLLLCVNLIYVTLCNFDWDLAYSMIVVYPNTFHDQVHAVVKFKSYLACHPKNTTHGIKMHFFFSWIFHSSYKLHIRESAEETGKIIRNLT